MSGQTSYGQNDGSAFIDGFNSVGVVHNDSQGYLSTSLIVTGDISDNAITSEKLAIDISYNGLFKVNNIDNASVDSQVANKKYVDDQITEIRGGVPQVTVDTLKELTPLERFINPKNLTSLIAVNATEYAVEGNDGEKLTEAVNGAEPGVADPVFQRLAFIVPALTGIKYDALSTYEALDTRFVPVNIDPVT